MAHSEVKHSPLNVKKRLGKESQCVIQRYVLPRYVYLGVCYAARFAIRYLSIFRDLYTRDKHKTFFLFKDRLCDGIQIKSSRLQNEHHVLSIQTRQEPGTQCYDKKVLLPVAIMVMVCQIIYLGISLFGVLH
jgi:hypothetical protein